MIRIIIELPIATQDYSECLYILRTVYIEHNQPPFASWMATDLLITGLTPVRFRKLSVKKKASMLYGEGTAAGGKYTEEKL